MSIELGGMKIYDNGEIIFTIINLGEIVKASWLTEDGREFHPSLTEVGKETCNRLIELWEKENNDKTIENLQKIRFATPLKFKWKWEIFDGRIRLITNNNNYLLPENEAARDILEALVKAWDIINK